MKQNYFLISKGILIASIGFLGAVLVNAQYCVPTEDSYCDTERINGVAFTTLNNSNNV